MLLARGEHENYRSVESVLAHHARQFHYEGGAAAVVFHAFSRAVDVATFGTARVEVTFDYDEFVGVRARTREYTDHVAVRGHVAHQLVESNVTDLESPPTTGREVCEAIVHPAPRRADAVGGAHRI